MPKNLKASIQGGLSRAPGFEGRTAEQSAYAIMNSIGAVKGSKTTRKGRRMERKITDRRGRSDRGEVLSTG